MSDPWMKFYPSDWRADPALRMCSLAARGLWAEMMCIMHEAEPYGHLLINGLPLNEKQLASLSGGGLRETVNALAELDCCGVLSRTEAGVIFSRRMKRDKEKAERDKANGKRGGNPSVKPGVNPEVKAQIPEARVQNIERQDSGAVAPKASRAKRERKYATALPDSFEPNYEAATRSNLSRREGEREFVKFKNHAAQTGRTCVSWQAAWSNWCINAAQYLKRPPPGAPANAAATITPESKNWNAWKAHFRDNNENVKASIMDKCADEGRPFTVPSQWPPGHEMNNAA